MTVPPSSSKDQPVWLRVGTLLDGTSTAPAKDTHVVYDREVIRFVGRDGQTPPRDVVRAGQTAPTSVRLMPPCCPA